MDEALEQSARRARDAVRSGELHGRALRSAIEDVPFLDRDAWVDAVLGLDSAPADAPNLPRGAVPYLPCSVDEILSALDAAPVHATDDFVDLGAGLGRVAMLARLLTGARARGIEIQPHLVSLAKAYATALHLHVAIEVGDAAEVPFSGTVFFLYAPFNGSLLARVLARLEAAASARPIIVCAVAVELDGYAWLVPRPRASPTVTIYDSVPCRAASGGRGE